MTVAASRDLLAPDDRRRLVELAVFPEEAHVPLTTIGVLSRSSDCPHSAIDEQFGEWTMRRDRGRNQLDDLMLRLNRACVRPGRSLG